MCFSNKKRSCVYLETQKSYLVVSKLPLYASMLCKTHAYKIKASQKHTSNADIGVPISVVTQGSTLTIQNYMV